MNRTGILSSEYSIYSSPETLPEPERALLEAAHKATKLAYAPYSEFYVGAALQLHSGETISGGNQENASYPLCLCAERVALAAASSRGPNLRVEAIAVTAHNPRRLLEVPVPPCGACRQVIAEKQQAQKSPIQIILQGESGQVFVFPSINALLPFSFDGDFL